MEQTSNPCPASACPDNQGSIEQLFEIASPLGIALKPTTAPEELKLLMAYFSIAGDRKDDRSLPRQQLLHACFYLLRKLYRGKFINKADLLALKQRVAGM